jgi:hypothetical protein
MKSNLKKVLAILLICILLIVFTMLVYHQINSYINGISKITNTADYCTQDSDCIKASCCHASSCTNVKNAPDCKGLYCTQECSSILDCGQSNCACINNKCNVDKTKNLTKTKRDII